MQFHLPAALLQAIECHAQATFPEECCGLIIGWQDDANYQAVELLPSPNVSSGDRTRTFEIDPQIRFDCIRGERENRFPDGAKLIGFYHSHPSGPATPSQTDRKMVFEPDLIWIITGNGQTNAFKFEETLNDFVQLPVQINHI